MRQFLLAAVASSTLILGGCGASGSSTSSASSSVATKVAPDFAAAVGAQGRTQADVKLDASRNPAQTLAFMGLETGDKALDIFAGGGYYTEVMAAAVGPSGSVVAVNPPQFVSSDAAKTKWAGVTERQAGVTMIPTQLSDFTPDAESYDFAMMHLIYHDLYWESEKFKVARMDPAAFLSKLYTGMKPGGIVAVIDHVGGEGETRAVVEKTHRINPAVVKVDFEKAGFVLEAESDMFANPNDDVEKNVFDPTIRGKTNRFAMKFRKSE